MLTREGAIQAWQEARRLTDLVHEETKKRPFAAHAALRDRTRRSAISVVASTIHAFGRRSSSELFPALATARGALHELRSHLFGALGRKCLPQEAFANVDHQLQLVLSLLNTLLA